VTVEPEVAELAQDFLATLPDPHVMWGPKFAAWASERSLGSEIAHKVKVMVLRIRAFAAVQRHRPRRRRRT